MKKMKTSLPLLMASLGFVLAGQAVGQTFTILHSFSAVPSTFPYTNADGATIDAGLVLSGNTLHGTAFYGGSSGNGTVFKVNTDGTGFTNLYSFTGLDVATSTTNSDGAYPGGGLVSSGNTLYGTAIYGGSSGNGTVFKVNSDGTGFTNLHSFAAGFGLSGTNSDGANPFAGLVLSGNTLYSTARGGGNWGNGTVFRVNTDGTGFTNLHSFTAGLGTSGTNSDGGFPQAGLVLSSNTVYGTAYNGGSSGNGTVFKVNTDGTGFTNLYSFTALDVTTSTTNSDGANPQARLVLSGNTLYGTASAGGSTGNGTLFKVSTDGTGFTTLYSFTAGLGPNYTNSDGNAPSAGLVLSGNTLFGTALGGGSSGNGTLFKLNIDGTGFTNLYSFTAGFGLSGTNSDGANPVAELVLSSDILYGTARGGGSWGSGTVFSISSGLTSAPILTITRSQQNILLTWPTNPSGFVLQFITSLVSRTGWSNVSPGPVVVNGQNTVTNPISSSQQFYRLSQ
jgi:uncharacterized repeat protein (TIGR03803 family)